MDKRKNDRHQTNTIMMVKDNMTQENNMVRKYQTQIMMNHDKLD